MMWNSLVPPKDIAVWSNEQARHFQFLMQNEEKQGRF